MKKLPLFILIFAFGVSAQDICPTVKNSATGITKVSNINTKLSKDFTCRKVTRSGTISGISFNSDDAAEAAGITIQLSTGQSVRIWLHNYAFMDCLSEAEKGSWRAQIKKGIKVKVTSWACRAGRKSGLSMEEIEFLPFTKRKNK